jgi:uncharacterized membrane protein YidH (DUF202 family)
MYNIYEILRSIITAIILIGVLLILVGMVRYIPKLETIPIKKTILPKKKSKKSTKRR